MSWLTVSKAFWKSTKTPPATLPSSRAARMDSVILKYVSKLKAHFVKMVNIFRNFYGIRDFTFAMHSYDNEDNFPLWLIKNPAYLQLKKEDEKFPGFRRGSLVPEKSIYGESPALAVSENVFGFIIRARRRPQITPNDRQLTKNTTSKNSKRRGYTVAQTTSVNQ